MTGMHCDSCGELFEYSERLIALHRDDGELVAAYAIEPGGRGDRRDVLALRQVPRPLLRGMREQSSDEWPALQ
jgi:hypothetical protein